MRVAPVARHFVVVFAALCILVGALVPPASLMSFFRPGGGDFGEQLLLGASYFKICLAILGIAILLLGRLNIWQEHSDSSADGRKPPSKLVTLALALILVASVLLRMYQLNAGLWLDEILTYVNYARLPMGELVTTYSSENQHFLYSALARVSFLFFGESSWALRLPAVLFGVGSLWALFLFARLVTDDREALLATALLAFSYHHVWFSQNARGYTGLLFWTMLSSWLLVRAMRELRTHLWAWYALSAALGMYTHLTMVFVILGQSVAYVIHLLRERQRIRSSGSTWWAGILLGFGGAVLVTVTLYALVIPQMSGAAEESVVSEWKSPLWTLLEFINGIQLNFTGGMAAVGVIAVIAGAIVFGSGVWSFLHGNVYVPILLFVPAIVGATAIIALGHHLWPRFFFFAFGFGAVVAVRGVTISANWLSKRLKMAPSEATWPGVVLSLAMIIMSAASVLFAYGPKQDYAGALAFVENELEPGDAITSASLAALVYDDFFRVDWQTVESRDELNEIRSSATRTWVLYTFPPVLESMFPDVMRSIEDEFQLVREFHGSVREGTLFVAVSNPMASG